MPMATAAYKRAQARYRPLPERNKSNDKNDAVDDEEYVISQEWVDFGPFSEADAPPTSDPRIRRVERSSTTTNNNNNNNDSTANTHDLHRRDVPCFELVAAPGFLFFPQALSEAAQRDLAWRAVAEYCEPPHATNLDDIHSNNNNEKTDASKNKDSKKNEEKFTSSDAPPEMRKTKWYWDSWKNGTNENGHHYPQTQQTRKRKLIPSNGTNSRKSFPLAWATCGYHYDWTRRSYDPAIQSPMPPLLQSLSEHFAQYSFSRALADSASSSKSPELAAAAAAPKRFAASAAIVNYYTPKSRMGGHRDDLEEAMECPVVSFSLGLPALFLLGGGLSSDNSDNDEIVHAIVVRPGDVMVLGGASRLRLHGVVRVFSAAQAALYVRPVGMAKQEEEEDSTKTAPPQHDSELWEFLQTHRININVRQVYSHDRPVES